MQSQKRNGPLNAKAIKQRQKRNRPLNAKAIKQSQKRNALLKGNGSGRVLNLLARRKECDSGSPWASENTNEAFKRIKLPKAMFGTPLQRTELSCFPQTLKDTKISSLLLPVSLAEVPRSWSLALHHPLLQFLNQAAWLLFQQWSQHFQSPFLLEPRPTLLHSIELSIFHWQMFNS
eukprot:Em0009g341a